MFADLFPFSQLKNSFSEFEIVSMCAEGFLLLICYFFKQQRHGENANLN